MPEQNIGTSQTLATVLQVVAMAESLAPGIITIIREMLASGKTIEQLLLEANAISTNVINRAQSEQSKTPLAGS